MSPVRSYKLLPASPFRLFTLGFPQSRHLLLYSHNCTNSRADIARRTAKWLGVKFVPILMDDDALATNFEDATWYSETVVPDANGPGKMAMAERAHAAGLKVVLTG